MDGGGEKAGVDDSMRNRRANKNGSGSYHHENFVTRSELEQAGDKNRELLNAFMDLNGVTEEEHLVTKKRCPTLDPVAKFESCPGVLCRVHKGEAVFGGWQIC